jgi:hypothetical protein
LEYDVDDFEIVLARGRRVLKATKISEENASYALEELNALAEANDRLILKVRSVKRIDHNGNCVPVKGMFDEVYLVKVNE